MTPPAQPAASGQSPSGIRGGFRRSWEAEVLAAPPLITPARHYTFPRAIPGEEEALARGALELLVRPAEGGGFLATCWMGFLSPSLPSGVWSCPKADELCAVAGGYAYMIDTRMPERATQVALRPVTELRALPDQELLLLVGFNNMVAWGVEGLRWTSRRLSWEGVTLGEVKDGHLTGTGWEMLSDRELPFSLDLVTGEHVGGGYLLPGRQP